MKSDERSSAVQYANALLQLTNEFGGAEEVYTNLETVSRVLDAEPELMVLFRHPAISSTEKEKCLNEFSEKMDKLSGRLLHILCERRKLHLLAAIVTEFKQLLLNKHNIVQGVLISADHMDEESVKNIQSRLVSKLGKRVQLAVEIDKSLIGGYILRIGDQVIDGSLKGRLQGIEKALLAV